jgi:hypothetical protein
MELLVKKQTSKQPFWTDEKGIQIPYNRITPLERKMEVKSFNLAKKAVDLHNRLSEFKREVAEICQGIYEQYMAENKVKKTAKGNFTWYNFDRSIKIEVSVNERIEFDDMAIDAAKAKLEEFLQNNVEAKDEFVKELIMNAFETSRGKLDVKKVMSLVRYKSKIKAPLYQEAIELIENGIRRPDSKMYFRVWQRDEEGKYIYIDLNLSSITF